MIEANLVLSVVLILLSGINAYSSYKKYIIVKKYENSVNEYKDFLLNIDKKIKEANNPLSFKIEESCVSTSADIISNIQRFMNFYKKDGYDFIDLEIKEIYNCFSETIFYKKKIAVNNIENDTAELVNFFNNSKQLRIVFIFYKTQKLTAEELLPKTELLKLKTQKEILALG